MVLLCLDLILGLAGFVFFLFAGIVLAAVIDVKKIPGPYGGLLTLGPSEQALAAVVAFAIALVFLYVILYLIAVQWDSTCVRFLQTKIFQELVIIFRYSSTGRKSESTGDQMLSTDSSLPPPPPPAGHEEAETRAAEGDEPLIPTDTRQEAVPSTMDLRPITEPSKMPNWKKAPDRDREENIGFSTDEHGNWSYHGHLRVPGNAPKSTPD